MSEFKIDDRVLCVKTGGAAEPVIDGVEYIVEGLGRDGVYINDNFYFDNRFVPAPRKASTTSTTYEQRVQAFELYVALLRANGDDGRYTPETVLAFLAP